MGMFDKYDNLPIDYVPNNTTSYLDVDFLTIDSDIPRPLYNFKEEFIGYTWDRGEIFDFVMSVEDVITVRQNSLIFDKYGDGPTTETVGDFKGQQAYNTVEGRSWTYVGIVDKMFAWVEDDGLTYPVNGDKSIKIHTDMKNKYIELTISDFRENVIHTQIGEMNNPTITLKVNKELEKTLVPGLYHATLKICSLDTQFVKSRFAINIK